METGQADTYRVIENGGEGLYTEKRSRFLSFAHYVADEAAAKNWVAVYKKRFFDARHVCYAYALGNHGERTRTNDDGEPGGTAGRPILGQIHSFGVTYTLVVVVRYFGGVKLGTGGLTVAYKEAAAAALANSTIGERLITEELTVAVPYTLMDTVLRLIREFQTDVMRREYTDTENILTLSVRKAEYDALRAHLGRLYPIRFIEQAGQPIEE